MMAAGIRARGQKPLQNMEPLLASPRAFASAANRSWLALSLLGLAGVALCAAGLLIGWTEVRAGVAHSYQVCLVLFSRHLVAPAWLVTLGAAGMMASVLTAGISIWWDAVRTRRLVRRLQAGASGKHLLGQMVVVRDESPFAITAGFLRPKVYVSSGLLAMLDDRELEAVLQHESAHVRRRDPLRRLVGRAARRALFFLPVVHDLWDRYHAGAELAADAGAVNRVGRDPVARAFLKLLDLQGQAGELRAASGFATMLDLRAAYLLAPRSGVRLPAIRRARLAASIGIPAMLIVPAPWVTPPSFVDVFAHLIAGCGL
jgi:Zn-dependent protease with chaperone function